MKGQCTLFQKAGLDGGKGVVLLRTPCKTRVRWLHVEQNSEITTQGGGKESWGGKEKQDTFWHEQQKKANRKIGKTQPGIRAKIKKTFLQTPVNESRKRGVPWVDTALCKNDAEDGFPSSRLMTATKKRVLHSSHRSFPTVKSRKGRLR